MTRSPFILSPESVDDLDEIWLYIAEDDIEAADRFEEKLRNAMQLVADRPQIGHLRNDLTDQPVKFWSVDTYLIIYDSAESPIRIVRVLSGSRDISAIL